MVFIVLLYQQLFVGNLGHIFSPRKFNFSRCEMRDIDGMDLLLAIFMTMFTGLVVAILVVIVSELYEYIGSWASLLPFFLFISVASWYKVINK